MKFVPSIAQDLALEHLRENDEAALFMGCGLGKTAVVLHRLLELFVDCESRGALVVAPLRVCNLTWPAEILKWEDTGIIPFANLRTKRGWKALEEGSALLYLINYEMLPVLWERYLKKRKVLAFDTVIWDEITRAKNHRSKRINPVRPYFRAHCIRHWGLTGTPAPNGLLDLFAQVRLLDGGKRLGPAYLAYKEGWFEAQDYQGYNWKPKPGSKTQIYKRLEGFALTLLSSDYLDIPDTIQEDIDVPLDPSVRAQYHELERELILLLNKEDAVIARNAAVLVGKLLQLVSGAVYLDDKTWRHIHDAKLHALGALLKKLDGEPILIATAFEHEQVRICKAFPQVVRFDSAGSSIARQTELIARWNRGEIPALVTHPASMAHGLNMQDGGCKVVWFTLSWSRELYDQMNSRVARRGQDQVTTIYRILTADSADWIVAEALRAKEEEQNALLYALRAWQNSRK